MSIVKQYYGIKYPFTINNESGLFIDLNETKDDDILSQILHVIMTRKNTRIKMPDFGTDLIKYIFELNDESTWSNIKSEIIESVSKYVPGVILKDIRVLRDDSEDSKILVDIEYNVKRGVSEESNRVVVKL